MIFKQVKLKGEIKFFDSNGIELFEVDDSKKGNKVREFVDANGKLRTFSGESSKELFYNETELNAEMETKMEKIDESEFEYTFLNYLLLNPIIIMSLLGAVLIICISIYVKYFAISS